MVVVNVYKSPKPFAQSPARLSQTSDRTRLDDRGRVLGSSFPRQAEVDTEQHAVRDRPERHRYPPVTAAQVYLLFRSAESQSVLGRPPGKAIAQFSSLISPAAMMKRNGCPCI